MIALLPQGSGAQEPSASEWKVLAPLPDPVGFGGMFAGVVNGRLIAGGGSQWTKPAWLDGTKIYSDRMFTLESPGGAWIEMSAHLPAKSGHFAVANSSGAIYLAGGFDASRCLDSVFRLRERGRLLDWERLPNLPVPTGYAVGAIVGDRFYVVGGLNAAAAKVAQNTVWSLDIGDPAGGEGWRSEPELPGPGVFVAAAGSDASGLYVFGGMSFDPEGKSAPSKRAYRFVPTSGRWTRLVDLPEPRVSAASPCPVLPDGKILIIGGYAKVFDGEARDYPGFNAQTLSYDTHRDVWENGPVLPVSDVPNRDSPGDPGPAPMISAPGVVWQDQVVVVSGEVRASVRSPAVIAWTIPDTVEP